MVVALRSSNYDARTRVGVGFGAAMSSTQAFPMTRRVPNITNNVDNKSTWNANTHINNENRSPPTRNQRPFAPLVKNPTYQFVLSTTFQPSSRPAPATEPQNSRSTGGFNKVLNPYVGKKFLPNGLPIAPARKPAAKKRKMSASVSIRKEPAVIERVVSRASSIIAENTFRYLEDFEELRRKQTSKRRISDCLVNLRAASERSATLREFLASPRPRANSLRNVVGDVGLALFSPLDPDAFEPLQRTQPSDDADEPQNEPLEYPIDISPETQSVLTSCPRLLTPNMLNQLMHHLPPTVKTMTWKRLFALGRDGDAFWSMLDRCHSFANTILVIETTQGHILGGYASAPWDRQGGTTRCFYGSGQSFLFATHPDGADDSLEATSDDKIFVYPWTGNNNYCQVCDVDDGQMAMGGGGSFGLIVQDNFSRGSTGRCDTFGNPALIPGSSNVGGAFEVVAFEIYGFSSMADAFSPVRTENPKQISLLDAE